VEEFVELVVEEEDGKDGRKILKKEFFFFCLMAIIG
jgi:hypothetical protein